MRARANSTHDDAIEGDLLLDSWFSQARKTLSRIRGRTYASRVPKEAVPTGTFAVLEEHEVRAARSAPDLDTTFVFAARLAHALLAHGLPVNRIEEALVRLSVELGFDASVYATPSAMVLHLAHGERQRTRVLQVVPGDADLGKLTAIHALVGKVEEGQLDLDEALSSLDRIVAAKPQWGRTRFLLAHALVAFGSALLVGGTRFEAVAACGVSLVGALVSLVFLKHPISSRLLSIAVAFIAGGLSTTAEQLGWPARAEIITVAALILWLPGLTVTIAVLEVATANLVSGTARLTGGFMTLLQLGFGATLGARVAGLYGSRTFVPTGEVPMWVNIGALFLAATGFMLALRVPKKETVYVLGSCTVAMTGMHVGAPFGTDMGTFLGAAAVTVTSHLYARKHDQPSHLLLLPGIFMLVPGSLGFIGIAALQQAQVEQSLQAVYSMVTLALSLSTGMLVGTMAVPPHRSL